MATSASSDTPLPEMKHSPGPWEVDTSKALKRVIYVFSGNTDLAVMLGRRDPAVDPMIADAHLMAAAPELLAALQTAEAALRQYEVFLAKREPGARETSVYPWGQFVAAEARAAIAKATLPSAEGDTHAG